MERDHESLEEPVFLASLTEMTTFRVWPTDLDDDAEFVEL